METIGDSQAYEVARQQEPANTGARKSKHSLPMTIAALFYILLWSSAFIATKIGVTHSPPLTLLTIRFLCAALLMALLAWIGKFSWPQGWSAWGRLALFGFLNSAFYLQRRAERLSPHELILFCQRDSHSGETIREHLER